MGRDANKMQVGFGFDVHRLVEGRPLILGGIRISFHKGLLGHSDGDVLVHAIIDAILGAIGGGDIGEHFPDSDPKLKGISSLEMLAKVKAMLKDKGFILSHLDTTIVTEAPKLNPYFLEIKKMILTILKIPLENLNLKAKTTEGLGYIGKGEGIAAYAIALVKKR
jgi:2-C-methyl-D-erythritol 2,4-cyclodiphosphate synthase